MAMPADETDPRGSFPTSRPFARERASTWSVVPSRQPTLKVVSTSVGCSMQALATEIVCVLRYKRHYYSARGSAGRLAATEFLEHANDEQQHADRIAERIVQLGGDPDLDPRTIAGRSHSEYDTHESLRAMLEADLFAERIAIESYREMVRYFGDRDPTSRRMMEEILAVEEEHADDLVDLLHDVPAT